MNQAINRVASQDNLFRDIQQTGPDLVLGLGLSGFSCARFLMRAGRALRIADSRPVPPFAEALLAQEPDVEMHLGEFDVNLLDGVERVIVSPGLSSREPVLQEALRRGLRLISDIELFASVAPAPVIGITGSNGKSTVTSWIAHVLSSCGLDICAGGNLGTPALDLLEVPIPDYYVLELSSFQLERTDALYLKAAVILNLGTDHLDHHGSIEQYHQAKLRILQHCDNAVLHTGIRDQLQTENLPSVIWYGDHKCVECRYYLESAQQENDQWLCRDGVRIAPASVLKVVGKHNRENALAVLTIAECCGVSWQQALESLVSFTGLPHRMQWIGETRGVSWINDSKGTNVDATIAALRSLSGPIVLIAGGQGKGADFSALALAIEASGIEIRAAVLIGEDGPDLESALNKVCVTHLALDMNNAVQQANTIAQPGDTVLLSPACASFDMFDGYEHRGEVFASAWRSLA